MPVTQGNPRSACQVAPTVVHTGQRMLLYKLLSLCVPGTRVLQCGGDAAGESTRIGYLGKLLNFLTEADGAEPAAR